MLCMWKIGKDDLSWVSRLVFDDLRATSLETALRLMVAHSTLLERSATSAALQGTYLAIVPPLKSTGL